MAFMALGRVEASQDSLGEIVAFTSGAALAIAASSLAPDAWVNRKHPLAGALGFLVAIAALLVVPKIRRSPKTKIIAFGFFPLVVFGLVSAAINADDATENHLRGIGIILSFATLFCTSAWLARRLRELDRQVLMQASAITFFVLVIGAMVYGTASKFLGAPDLSFTWLTIAGVLVEVVACMIFEKRMS